MKAISLLITDRQYKVLKERSKKLEIKVSEQIRRSIDDYLKKEEIREKF
ncbi:MAG: ribbon-helix-helix domain-containing protein [Candidatus Desulfofervidaceae bacterium]|nr:ribbon-helix-helix domain-containing protein [Candidatus Desulfofervidaceae bacterium]